MGVFHAIAHNQVLAPLGHTAATSIVVGNVVGLMTPTFGLLSLIAATVWYCITIWETVTFQRFVSWLKSKF